MNPSARRPRTSPNGKEPPRTNDARPGLSSVPRYAIAGIDPTVAMTLTILAVCVGIAPHFGRFDLLREVVFFVLLVGVVYPFCRYTAFGPRQFLALMQRPRPSLNTLIAEARQTLLIGVRLPPRR